MTYRDDVDARLSAMIASKQSAHKLSCTYEESFCDAYVCLSSEEWSWDTDLSYDREEISKVLPCLKSKSTIGRYHISEYSLFFEISSLSSLRTYRLVSAAAGIAEEIRRLVSQGPCQKAFDILDPTTFTHALGLRCPQDIKLLLPVISRLIGVQKSWIRPATNEIVIIWPNIIPDSTSPIHLESPPQSAAQVEVQAEDRLSRPGVKPVYSIYKPSGYLASNLTPERFERRSRPRESTVVAVRKSAVANLMKHRSRKMDWAAFVRDKEAP